jgi:hypothetical protein
LKLKLVTTDTKKVTALLGLCFPSRVEDINSFKDLDSITITAEKTPVGRTRPQENYYRQWCNKFGHWCGLTPDEMHEELLCQTFGTEEVETKFGVKRRPAKRSGQVKKEEYSLLIEQLIITAAQMGFAVPPAESVDE